VIVLDASAAVELLLGTQLGGDVARHLLADRGGPCAPHLLDVEVAGALRRGVGRGLLEPARGAEALEDLTELAVVRYPHRPLLPRIWALRDRLSAYDAAYVALAEHLGASLLTRDSRLARAGGHRARIELVE
jgi:predicted nucleic acid-binding protein